MRPSRRSAAALALLGLALVGFDWPGAPGQLTEAYSSSTPARRLELLSEVAPRRDEAARALVLRALGDDDEGVRLGAAELVTRYRLGGCEEPLVAWLDAPNPELRATAARALGALGQASTLPALVRTLGDADTAVRLRSVEAVASLGSADATVALLDRLADGESQVRVATARALGRLGDPRAVLSLLGALQDSIPEVRQAAAVALGQLRDPRAARGLLTLLHDGSQDVRLAAARALGTLGAPEAVTELAALALGEGTAGDRAARQQLAEVAVEALGRIDTPTARGVLTQAFREAGSAFEVSRAAAQALGREGASAQDQVPALVAEPRHLHLRPLLITLLGDVGGPRAAEVLTSWLGDERFRGPILEALGRTGTPEAVVTLLNAVVERAPGRARETRPFTGIARPRSDWQQAALRGLRAWAAARGALDPQALDPLVDILGAVPTTHLADVIALLGYTRNSRASAVLAPLLGSSRTDVRVAAAEALSRAGIRGVERALVDALADPHAQVRLHAADALSHHGDGAAVEALLARWRDPRALDRTSAARALGRIAARTGDARALPVLLEAMRHGAPGLAAAAVDALADLAGRGDPGALRALTEALRDGVQPGPVAEATANALAQAEAGGEPSSGARGALTEALTRATREARDPWVRATAAWGLSRGGPRAVPTLVLALSDPHASVAANAAGALARVARADPSAVEAAREALCAAVEQRPHPLVRANALAALASAGLACDRDALRRTLATARSPWVRASAADALSALGARSGAGDETAARRDRIALERCAMEDPSGDVAARCRAARSGERATPGGQGASEGEREGVIDAVVLSDEGEDPLGETPYGLVLPEGVVRLGRTGPEGWLHERRTRPGEFVLIEVENLPLEY